VSNQHKEWNKEEIIKGIQEYYNLHQKTPRTNDFSNKNNLPSYTYALKILNCTKIEEIFNQCDLIRTEVIPYNKIDKEWGLNQLRLFYKILGKLPTKDEFKSNNFKPSYDFYYDNFGTLENAYYLAGLIEKPLTLKERLELSIKQLKTLAVQLNKCPTVFDYDSYNTKGLCRRELERKLNLKYNDICKRYIPHFPVNVDSDVSQEDIINKIKEIHNILGRPPKYIELINFGCHYTQTIFLSKFGYRYNQLIRSLGWEPTGTDTLKRTEEVMLDDFYNFFKELKGIPTFIDIDNNKNIASSGTYIKYFGSIENVCKLLDINYDEFYRNVSVSKYCFDSLGNICRSYAERDITNYFIYKNIRFDKEPKYSEIIKNINNRKRFDWKIYIGDKIYYVEYFGMFTNQKNNKIVKRYVKKTRKKIKLLYKNNIIDKCILIFPSMTKNKTLDEIFKPYINNINIVA